MRHVLIFVFLVILLSLPVRAMEFEAPAPPESAAGYLPKEADSFGEGLWNVLMAAGQAFAPAWSESVGCCVRVCAVLILCALVRQFASGTSGAALEIAGTAAAAALLLEPSAELIGLGAETSREIQEYGKLLLPVMAGALAARGGIGTSSALYAGTAVFDTILGWAVTKVMLPLIWMFLALSVAAAALGDDLLKKLRDLLRWTMEWALKLTLYVFTGYMAVTGVVSGTADAAASRAAKIALSGGIPVVGGILADAADAVLLSAGVLGSGAGIWGMLTVIAIFCAPVVRMGCRYCLLRITGAIGESLGCGGCAGLVSDFASAMGLIMGLISTQALLLLISTVCFLRGTA